MAVVLRHEATIVDNLGRFHWNSFGKIIGLLPDI
jgi:hypothetical protein